MKAMLVYSPLYQAGHSRLETVDAMKVAWALKAPWLLERRAIELSELSDPELVARFLDEVLKDWGSRLAHKSLPVVKVTDPLWEREPDKLEESVHALAAGYASAREPGEPRQFFVLGVDLRGRRRDA